MVGGLAGRAKGSAASRERGQRGSNRVQRALYSRPKSDELDPEA